MNLSKEALQVVNQLDKLPYSDEIEIMVHLFRKYNLKTISDYSDESGISRQTIYNKVNKGNIPSIELAGITFIIEM